MCQLGAREHYAVPRALAASNRLAGMFTDAWVPPGNPLGRLRRRLRDRFHQDLKASTVGAANLGLVQFEAGVRLRRRAGWQAIIERNAWFQRRALRWLQSSLKAQSGLFNDQPPVLFGYSYAALEILRWARQQGWTTVLGQIDPGIEEERLMVSLHARYHSLVPKWDCAPGGYWEDWLQECDVSDAIVVNSNWSRSLLIQAGVDSAKIDVIPLAYPVPAAASVYRRTFPDQFSDRRPLRALFLGQVTPRKGVIELLEAARLLGDVPVEFLMVGPVIVDPPEHLRQLRAVRFVGPIPRGHVAQWYRDADVFLFPTHSDGFGLTQLEAQAWKLPIVASRNCGDVVVDGKNGLLLSEVSADEIAVAIRRLCNEPGLVAALSDGQQSVPQRSLRDLSNDLIRLEQRLGPARK